MLKRRIKEVALKYLLDKKGKKGREIKNKSLEMADYLLPFNNKMSIQEKCESFAIRDRMIQIPSNFSSNCEQKCICGKMENRSIFMNAKYLMRMKITVFLMKKYTMEI